MLAVSYRLDCAQRTTRPINIDKNPTHTALLRLQDVDIRYANGANNAIHDAVP